MSVRIDGGRALTRPSSTITISSTPAASPRRSIATTAIKLATTLTLTWPLAEPGKATSSATRTTARRRPSRVAYTLSETPLPPPTIAATAIGKIHPTASAVHLVPALRTRSSATQPRTYATRPDRTMAAPRAAGAGEVAVSFQSTGAGRPSTAATRTGSRARPTMIAASTRAAVVVTTSRIGFVSVVVARSLLENGIRRARHV